MKRIERRSAAALLLAGLILLGLGVLIVRLWRHGGDWAAYRANLHIYQNGVLTAGEITDRNGVVLLRVDHGEYAYAEDSRVRRASLHAVGDKTGYIGGTALSSFGGEMTGWNMLTGTDGLGGSVAIALDSRLQAAAWDALGGRNGAVVVMNYETGELLCLTSAPAYDPIYGANLGTQGVLISRCTGAAFTPGSVFKLVTLIAARENIPELADRRFTCKGGMDVRGEEVKCTGSHGTQTVEQALANSCNVAFGQLALELGGETLRETARRLGLEGSLTLDGHETAAGVFESAAPGTSLEAWSGIGQYHDLVTPFAMARLCAAIANGGTLREPSLRKGGGGERSALMDAAVAEFTGECMSYAVAYGYGGMFPGLDLCAKTGTAELGDGTDHAWLVGYLRSGAPLAFAVMVERGGSGLYQAGPVARAVLNKALEYYGQ